MAELLIMRINEMMNQFKGQVAGIAVRAGKGLQEWLPSGPIVEHEQEGGGANLPSFALLQHNTAKNGSQRFSLRTQLAKNLPALGRADAVKLLQNTTDCPW